MGRDQPAREELVHVPFRSGDGEKAVLSTLTGSDSPEFQSQCYLLELDLGIFNVQIMRSPSELHVLSSKQLLICLSCCCILCKFVQFGQNMKKQKWNKTLNTDLNVSFHSEIMLSVKQPLRQHNQLHSLVWHALASTANV